MISGIWHWLSTPLTGWTYGWLILFVFAMKTGGYLGQVTYWAFKWALKRYYARRFARALTEWSRQGEP